MVRPVVHSTKHYVQFSLSQVATASRVNEDLAHAVESTTANLVDEVAEGTLIKAVFLELWVLDTGNDGSGVIIISKLPLDTVGPSFAAMNALGTYNNKKNILYTTQGLFPNDGIANPRVAFKGWIKIPKSKQRFGLGDRLVLTIANNSLQDLNYCGFCTYKEYS